jgi:hypothetical protein
MSIILGEMIHDTGDSRVDLAATQLLRANHLTRGRLHQRRTAEEDGALIAHDDGFVAHGRHVRAAGRARTHHHRDLRNSGRRHVGLVVEDAAEVFLVGEHFVLAGQMRAARIHQINAGQPVLLGHALRPQMFLDADRVVSTALHGGVVADDQAFAPGHAPHAGDDARARRLVAVHPPRRQRRQFQERRARIQQHLDPIAGQQFSARHVFRAGGLAASERNFELPRPQLLHQRAHGGGIGREFRTLPIDFGFEQRHDCRTIVQPRN